MALRIIKFVAPVAVFLIVWVLLSGFEGNQRAVGAIFAATVVLWMTEILPLGVTALLSTALLVLIAGVGEKVAFSSYGDVIVPLFIGSFILAKAMEETGLSRRLAYLMVAQKGASRSPGLLLLSLAVVACGISLVVSNTATTAMMLPIGVAIVAALGVDRPGSPFAIAMMLTLTWASSVAVGLPVGTPPNLIGISLIRESTGKTISFVEWMQFGMPITILMLLGSWLLLQVLYGRERPDTSAAPGIAREHLAEMGPMKRSEKNVLSAFGIAMLLWVLPDTSAIILGTENELAKMLQAQVTPAVAAVLAAGLLFVLPAETGPTITWRQARKIDWGTILLFGGGIALGQAMFSSGLAKNLGEMAARASGADTLWTITALSIAAAILLSELASNTAAATTLIPVVIGLANGAEVSPIPPALGAALGASLGFMLPVSTAPNAIVYSSGLVPARQMMKAGLLVDVLGFFVTYGCLRVILPLMNLD